MLGIAFSGGGVRASSHLGIYKALLEAGIKPEVFAGTSSGSIVATFLALGYSPDDVLKIFKDSSNNILDIDYLHIAKSILLRRPINGFAKGKSLENILEGYLKGMKIGEIKAKLAIVATDFTYGRQIIFSNYSPADHSLINDDKYTWFVDDDRTNLSYLISSSCSLPVVFRPKKYRSLMLLDGGVTNNLPSDLVRAMGATRTISIDLDKVAKIEQIGIHNTIAQTIGIFMQREIHNNINDLDVYLNPQITDVQVLDFSRIDECFERGYNYCKENIDSIKKQLEDK